MEKDIEGINFLNKPPPVEKLLITIQINSKKKGILINSSPYFYNILLK